MPRHDCAVIRGEPDRLGLGDQVANSENQPVIADNHAAACTLGPEHRRGECVLGNFGAKRHDRVEHRSEIETQTFGRRLQLGREGPVGRFCHGCRTSLVENAKSILRQFARCTGLPRLPICPHTCATGFLRVNQRFADSRSRVPGRCFLFRRRSTSCRSNDASANRFDRKGRSTHDFESNRSWRFTQVGGAGRACVVRRRKREGLGAKRAARAGEFRGDDILQFHTRSGHDLVPEACRQRESRTDRAAVVKAGWIFGGSSGRAVLFARNDQTGRWEGPAFYNLATASVGFQAGVAVSETITLVMTDRGLNSLLATSVKVGGDASIAAGPIGAGANADVTTDFVAFARSKGVYGGLNLDGTVVHVADNWNRAYYP